MRVVEGCELCTDSGGEVVLRNDRFRVVLVDDAAHPGFCRVILNAHVAEMTDLEPPDRREFFDAVLAVESALRSLLCPAKINLASLGNRTPHLHWHVIPRFPDDPEYPDAIWGRSIRPPADRPLPAGFRERLSGLLRAALKTGTRPR